MTSTSLALGGLLTMLEGLTYIFVGERLRRRVAAPGTVSALVCFFLFWYTAGANKIIAGAANYAASRDELSLDVYVSTLLVNFVFLAVGLGCLMYYVLFLLRGNNRFVYAVVSVYTLFYVFLTYSILYTEPNQLNLGDWRISHAGRNESPALLRLIILFLLAVPQIIGSLLLIRVRSHAQDATARYRLILVPLAIIAWTASIVLVSLPQFSEDPFMQLSSRLVGIAAALVCLMAYAPPRFIRRRLGVQGLEDVEPETSPKIIAPAR